MKQAAFLIESPDERNQIAAEYFARVQELLNVYAVLVKANPKDREDYLDNLIQQRDAGTLMQFAKERAVVAWRN